ncbi:MAG: type I methionyl aminopeptidase, partial [Candidatus Portnoybacteria bacterium CG_4_9_14_3_um_filter_44_9]
MITIKTEQEIEIMRRGGEILAKILDEIAQAVKPGITTNELDE